MRHRLRLAIRPAWLLPGVLACGWGCGAEPSDGLPRRAISGSVRFGGNPVESGSIAFDPDADGGAHAVSGGAMIRDGGYSIDRASGLTPGTYRVSIRSSGASSPLSGGAPGTPPRQAPRDLIPEKFNSKSTLKVELKDGGTSRFDFDLQN